MIRLMTLFHCVKGGVWNYKHRGYHNNLSRDQENP